MTLKYFSLLANQWLFLKDGHVTSKGAAYQRLQAFRVIEHAFKEGQGVPANMVQSGKQNAVTQMCIP